MHIPRLFSRLFSFMVGIAVAVSSHCGEFFPFFRIFIPVGIKYAEKQHIAYGNMGYAGQQCELKVIHSTQTAAAGAAIYAAVAAGKEKGGYDTIAEAVKRMSLPISKTYLPDKEAGKIYDQLYALFLGMSKAYAPREGDPMKVLKALKESSHRV